MTAIASKHFSKQQALRNIKLDISHLVTIANALKNLIHEDEKKFVIQMQCNSIDEHKKLYLVVVRNKISIEFITCVIEPKEGVTFMKHIIDRIQLPLIYEELIQKEKKEKSETKDSKDIVVEPYIRRKLKIISKAKS